MRGVKLTVRIIAGLFSLRMGEWRKGWLLEEDDQTVCEDPGLATVMREEQREAQCLNQEDYSDAALAHDRRPLNRALCCL